MRRTRHVPGAAMLARMAGPLMLVLTSASCSGGDEQFERVVRFDSAGVEVVVNRTTRVTDDPGWWVAPVPRVELGATDGTGPEVFSEILGGFVDERGRIVLLDGQSREIRFFDREGSLVQTAGGPGDGPGEIGPLSSFGSGPFHQPWALYSWRGDSILVHSRPLRTVYVLDAEGQEGRRTQHPELARWVDGTFGEERLLLHTSTGMAEGPPEDGWERARLLSFDVDGRVEELGLFPFRPEGDFVRHGPRGIWAPIQGGFLTARSDRPEILVHDWTGDLRRVIRLPLERRSVDDSLEEGTAQRVAQDWPYFSQARVDRDGNMWIAPGDWDGSGTSTNMLVVSSDGEYLGTVGLPAGLRPLDIGPDWILGVVLDDFDVPYVRVHALERGGR